MHRYTQHASSSLVKGNFAPDTTITQLRTTKCYDDHFQSFTTTVFASTPPLYFLFPLMLLPFPPPSSYQFPLPHFTSLPPISSPSSPMLLPISSSSFLHFPFLPLLPYAPTSPSSHFLTPIPLAISSPSSPMLLPISSFLHFPFLPCSYHFLSLLLHFLIPCS